MLKGSFQVSLGPSTRPTKVTKSLLNDHWNLRPDQLEGGSFYNVGSLWVAPRLKPQA